MSLPKQYFVAGVILLLAIFGGVNFYLQPDVLRVGVVVGWLIILAGVGVLVTHRAVTPLLMPGLIMIGAMLLSSLANFDIVDFSLSRVWLFVVALSVLIISHAYLSQADLYDGIYMASFFWPHIWTVMSLQGWVDNANVVSFWPFLFTIVFILSMEENVTLITMFKVCFFFLPNLYYLIEFWSRGAWLGGMMGVCVVLFASRRYWPLQLAVVLSFLGFLFYQNSTTAGYRFGYWLDAWHGFSQAPLFGLGPGGLKAGALITEPGDGGGYQIHAHNFLVSWLAQTGLIGLACLILAIQKIRSLVWSVAPWQAGLLVGLLVWSMVDEPLFWPGPLLAFGLVIGTLQEEKEMEVPKIFFNMLVERLTITIGMFILAVLVVIGFHQALMKLFSLVLIGILSGIHIGGTLILIGQWTNLKLEQIENDDFEEREDQDLEFFEYEIDEWEQASDDCGYHPESGFCLMAGTEYCDWDCKLSPIWEEEAV